MSVESLLRRDRIIEGLALGAVSVFAWLYLFAEAGMDMGDPGMGMMTGRMTWTPAYGLVVFFMWWVMMVAMMLPSASPTVLIFSKISARHAEGGKPFASTGVFAAGYLLIWGIFSFLATVAQWGLETTGLLSMMMESVSVWLSAIILIAAGLWQLTPLKHACLKHCRSPLHFVIHGFRQGNLGALRMGMEHGQYCLGCCWFLMALLFYGGVMNLYWIVGLAVYVLIEKLAPGGEWIAQAAGVALIGWGGWVLFHM